jgi:hypothetical protein
MIGASACATSSAQATRIAIAPKGGEFSWTRRMRGIYIANLFRRKEFGYLDETMARFWSKMPPLAM